MGGDDEDNKSSENETCLQIVTRVIRRNLLVLLTVVGVVVGFIVGFSVQREEPSDDVIMWLGLAGEVYMRMLKMMILPLIISTVITGTAAMHPKSQGRISMVSMVYIVISNSVPPIIGAVIVLILKPGLNIEKGTHKNSNHVIMETQDIFADLIRNLFPDNLISAAFEQTITRYEVTVNQQNITTITKVLGKTNGTNVLGLIICCTLFGVGTSSVGKAGKPFLKFFMSASEVILKVLKWLVWFTPIGVASLVATVLAKTSNLGSTFSHLGMFIVSSFVGLILLMYVIIPLVYFVLVRRSPVTFFCNLIRPLMITFATASSAIAIPDTLHFMEKYNHIDKRISRFVVPFSSALNKSGSALYISASCVFICQLEKIETDFPQVLIIIILTALSTFAVPSVPSAGIVTIIILLTAMNIPTEGVALLLAVEWFLDRCRTAGNLYSQNLCVAITQQLAGIDIVESATPDNDEIEIVINASNADKKSNADSTELTLLDEKHKLITNGSKEIPTSEATSDRAAIC